MVVVERRKPIKVKEAIERVMNFAINGGKDFISIEQANGHFLGEDLVADHDVPLFNRSPYDGFTFKSTDTENVSSENPVLLQVIGEIGAGSVFTETVKNCQAVRIMTGAQIPAGCDAVVMLERTQEINQDGKTFIQLKQSFKSGDNISYKGEDTKKGTVLAEKGTFITPGVIALLATFGYKQVPVSKKPKVGVIATGSELLQIDEPLQPGKIRNSNAYMICAQIERAGGLPIYLGQFNDNLETCFTQVQEALDKVDFLITTGGVSVGDYDYLPAIYEKLKADVLFNKVGMRPGSVTTIAEKDGKLMFGLSGNPSACYVGFELFTRPVIRTFLHCKQPFLKSETALLGVDFPKPNPFDRFVRGHLTFKDGKLLATPVGLDKSSSVSSLAMTNVLIVLPAGSRGYEEGMEVKAILLEDQYGTSYQSFLSKDNSKPGRKEHHHEQ
ncbi:molybdopterin molybdenumtransferase [Lottiidibacillus patelloidae]|uniref:Molybdopterin molybdenumtransferase n=1 Tax=Lottiidibacillus patelloidae TaxID=2670334 RepID=A0A263BSB6_9BACI|nr:gephyrin-like molybdotransferase Glp [Lottiidibacillus patelloidae]OZM56613.1 molybdopterin molybdenumtransferase [Lottiidibacillus patelloidae]